MERSIRFHGVFFDNVGGYYEIGLPEKKAAYEKAAEKLRLTEDLYKNVRADRR